MHLIPAIDLKDGHCVRLLRGDFAAETRYSADPMQLLARYRRFGADWLHVVDLDGAKDGTGANRVLVAQLAAAGGATTPRLNVQMGGGLRDTSSVAAALEAGVSRVVIGSAAITNVDLVRSWLRDFGPARVVLAFDVRVDAAGRPCVTTHGWREQSTLSMWQAIAQFADHGLQHVLCTDVSRDGALTGPNVELYAEAVGRFAQIAWQASGGIRDAGDLHALARIGAAAAISGKALLDDLIPAGELRPFLPNA
jgi:phosphoribosylformimino-5-aminoimidazole carboxamide ribotide isomerase